MGGADNPWIPFTPLSDQVFLKYWKVDPVRGDTVYEVAGSSHTTESLDDTEVFFILVGELLFLDEDKKILWQENDKTSIERYTNYCAANGIELRDLSSWDA